MLGWIVRTARSDPRHLMHPLRPARAVDKPDIVGAVVRLLIGRLMDAILVINGSANF